MKLVKEFDRNGNRATIIFDNGVYTATTLIQSKDFKTLKGAEKFLNKFQYVEVK